MKTEKNANTWFKPNLWNLSSKIENYILETIFASESTQYVSIERYSNIGICQIWDISRFISRYFEFASIFKVVREISTYNFYIYTIKESEILSI